MSRRATTPEGRGKRSHSFGADSSAEKRTRRDEAAVRRDIARDDEATIGPSTLTTDSAAASNVRGSYTESGPSNQRGRYSSPTMSSPSMSPPSEGSRTRRGSPSHVPVESSSSSARTRPTWQTDPSEQSEREWMREREREHTSQESREPRDRELRAPSTNPSRGLTPPGSASGGLQGQPQRSQAAFVNKLYSMLEDSKIAESGLLSWSADGTSFVCPNPTEFSKEVLPNYFKHNNWQSFVRQLNMYSFNKVSDLYSTANSDPQAWEFRHSKFLRGRPDLLPLIKRKPARQNQPDPPSVMASPGDEQDKPVAGWGIGPSHPGYRYTSPTPRDYRPPYYAAAHTRPVSSGYEAGLSHSPPRAHLAATRSGRPPSHSGYPYESSRSEPPYYPHSQPPPSRQPSGPEPSLTAQVATLQDNVNQLWTTLQYERYDRASRDLDMTNHMIRIADWASDPNKTRYPVEILHRQRTDIINRLEALQSQSSDMFGSSSTAHHDERRLGSAYETTMPSRSMPSAMHDPRQIHTSHSEAHHELSSYVPDRVRPATSAEGSLSYSGLPRSYPTHSHRAPPPPAEFRYGMSSEERRAREHSRAASSHRRDVDDPEDTALDYDSKTSLRNLLH